MQGNLVGPTVISFLHELFTAVWIGGLIVTGVAVVPAVKERFGASPQTNRLMLAIQGRLRVLVYISIAGLIITGMLMSRRSPQFQGLFSWSNSYSVFLALKHLLVIVMVAVALFRSLVLGKAPAPPAEESEPVSNGVGRESGPLPTGGASRRMRLSALLLMVNILLGVAVLLLSAAAAAVAS